jgi:hypothetical protein
MSHPAALPMKVLRRSTPSRMLFKEGTPPERRMAARGLRAPPKA